MDEVDRLRRLLADLADLTIWMLGSADFGPKGQAYTGWVKGRPALDRALAYLTEADRAEKLKTRSEAAKKAARSRKAMKDARDEADARRSSGGSR